MRLWDTRHSNGLIGSTTGDCSSRLVTSRRQSSRKRTMRGHIRSPHVFRTGSPRQAQDANKSTVCQDGLRHREMFQCRFFRGYFYTITLTGTQPWPSLSVHFPCFSSLWLEIRFLGRGDPRLLPIVVMSTSPARYRGLSEAHLRFAGVVEKQNARPRKIPGYWKAREVYFKLPLAFRI